MVKLLKIRLRKAAKLENTVNSLCGWQRAIQKGELNMGTEVQTSQKVISLTEDLSEMRKQRKEQEKEVRQLAMKTNFWRKRALFFTASRRKSARMRERNFGWLFPHSSHQALLNPLACTSTYFFVSLSFCSFSLSNGLIFVYFDILTYKLLSDIIVYNVGE